MAACLTSRPELNASSSMDAKAKVLHLLAQGDSHGTGTIHRDTFSSVLRPLLEDGGMPPEATSVFLKSVPVDQHGMVLYKDEITDLFDVPRSVQHAKGTHTRILLVSDHLPRHEILIHAAKRDVIVVPVQYLNWDLKTLTEEIVDRAGTPAKQFESIGILDHGNAGEFCFLQAVEGGTLNYENLSCNPELKDFFRFLGTYVKKPKQLGKWREDMDARIDLMACCVAANEDGERLIGYLEDLTQVNWAASTDPTGAGKNAEGGFDWIMDTEPGLASVHNCYFTEEIKEWKYTMARWNEKVEERILLKRLKNCGEEGKKALCLISKRYMEALLESVKNNEDKRQTLWEKHHEALYPAMQEVGGDWAPWFQSAVNKKALTYNVATSAVGAVALLGGRSGGTLWSTEAGNVSTKFMSGATATAAAEILAKATPTQLASLAGELAGIFVIARFFPIDEELLGFLDYVWKGAEEGTAYIQEGTEEVFSNSSGYPARFMKVLGAAGGALVGAGAWGVNWLVGPRVDRQIHFDLLGLDPFKMDMSLKFPDDLDLPEVEFEGEYVLFNETLTADSGAWKGLFPNNETRMIKVPDDVLITNIQVESHWKDGTNGHAELVELIDDEKSNFVFPVVGPTTLQVYIEAAPTRGMHWSVKVKAVDFEKFIGQKVKAGFF